MWSRILPLTVLAALSRMRQQVALVDTEFQANKMNQNAVLLGKGQCDMRLRIDVEADLSLRADRVHLRTNSGRDSRMPDRNAMNRRRAARWKVSTLRNTKECC